MRLSLLGLLAIMSFSAQAQELVSEVVYVESPTDTDSDGQRDRIYVSVSRPASDVALSSLFHISPYALGGTDVPMHGVDMERLPQDEMLTQLKSWEKEKSASRQALAIPLKPEVEGPRYAQVEAHSVGTGNSTGCPTVGDMAETLAAKSVIDWLNGRAKGFDRQGREVKATWANGKVGMTGTSYDGTLPIMVATTGVEGLKAIIPVAAISNWYDYYRANGLVVNPGGYIGEDADILGYFVVRRNACRAEMQRLTQIQGRENGDYTPFWQERNYVPSVKNIKAATFIIHGQSDWNVKMKHAIQLWEALEESGAPRRMFLHKGGHSSTWQHDVPKKTQAWFDHFLEGVENGITEGPQVEVELPDGSLMKQTEWPNETTVSQRLYLNGDAGLSPEARAVAEQTIIDAGRTQKVERLLANPSERSQQRLIFMSSPMSAPTVLSGTPRVSLNLAVMNRKAANISVALIAYDHSGSGRIITRGWADPQNHASIEEGELLVPGQNYKVEFDIEPKQYRLAAGQRLGVLVTSTDYDYTLRPAAGTEIKFTLGPDSFVDVRLSR